MNDHAMKDWTLISKTIVLLVSLVLVKTKANGQVPDHSHKTYRIEGLTSNQRDELVKQLEADGDYRIAFACVPAGLLVVEPVNLGQALDASRIEELILPRSMRSTIRAVDMDLQTAEASCAAARTR